MASPPIAPRRPHVISAHGDDRQDPWFWLREREDPKVLAYLEAENSFTEQEMAPLRALRSGLFEEMKARIKETDMSVPAPARTVVVLLAHRGGEGLRHPLPAPCPRPSGAAAGRGAR